MTQAQLQQLLDLQRELLIYLAFSHVDNAEIIHKVSEATAAVEVLSMQNTQLFEGFTEIPESLAGAALGPRGGRR